LGEKERQGGIDQTGRQVRMPYRNRNKRMTWSQAGAKMKTLADGKMNTQASEMTSRKNLYKGRHGMRPRHYNRPETQYQPDQSTRTRALETTNERYMSNKQYRTRSSAHGWFETRRLS